MSSTGCGMAVGEGDVTYSGSVDGVMDSEGVGVGEPEGVTLALEDGDPLTDGDTDGEGTESAALFRTALRR